MNRKSSSNRTATPWRAALALIPLLMLAILAAQFVIARAAETLTVTPLTWNVIGLDSNNVSVGPNHFPVGARVCNAGASTASNITATLVWDSTNDYIDFRPGTSSVLSVGSLAASACTDFYFEVEVDRDTNAYNTTRQYHIAVTADGGATTGVSPEPRELFVEHLVSQSRNSVSDVQLSLTGAAGSYSSVAAGGTMDLMVGSTYWIKLVGSTATNGYEQIEDFINFPNTVFRTMAVTTTYTADTSGNVTVPDDQLYGDACTWENNIYTTNYRSCLSTGKAGGAITVTYKVNIISIPNVNPEPLSTLIYDFSGSSYHYNADYGVSVRYAHITDASIVKSFSPKVINPGGTSVLTFTITNPGPQSISSVNFTDSLPADMSLANSTVTYGGDGCGSPTNGTTGTSLSFSTITVGALSTCTISVNVTASVQKTYPNTSGHLYIGTRDTGSYATDTLAATSKPAGPTGCASAVTLATWSVSDLSLPPVATIGPGDVSFATASSFGGAASIDTAEGNPVNSWKITGGWNAIGALPNSAAAPYFQFSLDTSNYGGVAISIDAYIGASGAWASGNNNFAYVYSQADTGSFSTATPVLISKQKWEVQTLAASSTGLGMTTFRINFGGASTAAAYAQVDNIVITGCPRPSLPTLSKAFSPTTIAQDGTSVLTFTFANPNASTALTGVVFTDTLPAGLVISTASGVTTPSCTSGTISGQTITAVAGTRLINMRGATLSAGATGCSFSVNVTGSTAGQYHNVSGSISSAETGPNTTSTGYGTADLTVVAPPVIAKAFGVNTLINGNSTTLTFSINNPNRIETLTGIQFTDTLPAGVDVSTSGPTSACGGAYTTTDNSPSQDTVVLSGGSLAAGANCTFSVTVTGSTNGLKNNSVTVSSTNGGTGNTATASMLVRSLTPAVSLKKQVGASATGPWYDSINTASGSNVYYRFTVENIGDVALNPVTITDDTLSSSLVSDCNTQLAVGGDLPVADADDNHIRTCVVGPVTAAAGSVKNTAYATGAYGGSPYNSANDSATYQNGNFGHLTYTKYKNLNVFSEGGAMHLNDDDVTKTRLGTWMTRTDSDGSKTNYSDRTTDDGIVPVNFSSWSVSTGGSVSVTVTCTAGPCYVYGWFDWNRDGDFNDAGEGLTPMTFNTSATPTEQTLPFSIPTDTILAGNTFYSRFRVYSALPANPSPYGLAVNSSGAALGGEIEDYDWYFPPTAVTLSAFYATPVDGQVLVNWQTVFELDSLGFNLYRSTSLDGPRTQVNAEMILSQGLGSMSAETNYQFVDGDVKPGIVYYYWLEEIDVHGPTLYGPVQVVFGSSIYLPLVVLH